MSKVDATYSEFSWVNFSLELLVILVLIVAILIVWKTVKKT
ncbi:hypothetical protein NSQ54_01170 [Alkalihalobacillus sp. FSL W8-0930]